jgi:hypothetical protein
VHLGRPIIGKDNGKLAASLAGASQSAPDGQRHVREVTGI